MTLTLSLASLLLPSLATTYYFFQHIPLSSLTFFRCFHLLAHIEPASVGNEIRSKTGTTLWPSSLAVLASLDRVCRRKTHADDRHTASCGCQCKRHLLFPGFQRSQSSLVTLALVTQSLSCIERHDVSVRCMVEDSAKVRSWSAASLLGLVTCERQGGVHGERRFRRGVDGGRESSPSQSATRLLLITVRHELMTHDDFSHVELGHWQLMVLHCGSSSSSLETICVSDCPCIKRPAT